MLVVPGGMQNCSYFHDSFSLVDFMNHAIRKSIRITPADIFSWVTATVEQRIFSQHIPYLDNFFDELFSQSGLAGFVPIRRRRDIGFDFRSELDPPVHLA